MDSLAHEETIICRQLFAGHVVCSRPMERKKKLHQMIIGFVEHKDQIVWQNISCEGNVMLYFCNN